DSFPWTPPLQATQIITGGRPSLTCRMNSKVSEYFQVCSVAMPVLPFCWFDLRVLCLLPPLNTRPTLILCHCGPHRSRQPPADESENSPAEQHQPLDGKR